MTLIEQPVTFIQISVLIIVSVYYGGSCVPHLPSTILIPSYIIPNVPTRDHSTRITLPRQINQRGGLLLLHDILAGVPRIITIHLSK